MSLEMQGAPRSSCLARLFVFTAGRGGATSDRPDGGAIHRLPARSRLLAVAAALLLAPYLPAGGATRGRPTRTRPSALVAILLVALAWASLAGHQFETSAQHGHRHAVPSPAAGPAVAAGGWSYPVVEDYRWRDVPATAAAPSRLRQPAVRVRWFRRRVPYSANTGASRQLGRFVFAPSVLLAGDIEVNPGPASRHVRPGPAAGGGGRPGGGGPRRPGSGVNALGTITLFNQNVRSLKKQLGGLRLLAPTLERYDIISFTESWLNDTVQDCELQLGYDDHTWFRRDRGSLGGGVACAVRSSLLPVRLPDPAGAEMLLLRLQRIGVTLAVCYRPPGDDDALTAVAAALSSVAPGARLIVVGDFNLPEVVWTVTDDGVVPMPRRGAVRAVRFVDECGTLGLKQWVTEPSRGLNMLDLLFSRFLTCTSINVTDGLFDSDHKDIICEFRVPKSCSAVVSRRTAYNYKDADFQGLRRALSLINWGMLDCVDVNEAVDTFYELLESALADHIPTVTVRRRCPPWFDGSVRAALREKEAAFRRMRRCPSDESTARFAEKRKAFKSLAASKYRQYLVKLTDDLKTNPKRYWTFVKCVGKTSKMSSVLYRDDGSLASDDTERAEIFNKAFAGKFSKPSPSIFPHAKSYPIDSLSHFYVTESSIRAALNQLTQNKACGPDNISARIILECREELVVPLTKICSMSVASGVFPERWKRANIVPIFKKGDKKSAENYRSVSLLPLFAKILEKVVYDQLYRHVEPALCNEQHGFVPGRSCTSNLAVFLTSAWEAISEGYQTDTIYTDFTAAFQSVNHGYLIHKLKNSFHVHGSALMWFVSYLSDRRQRVTLNGKTSEWTSVISGNPEGSLLAPILFSIFINDLPSELDSECLLYADDAKIYRKITTPQDAATLQTDIDRLSSWSATWGLSLNPAKCKAFSVTLRRAPVRTTYRIGSAVLESVDEIKDLGVTIDSKLSFSAHVSRIVCQANRALGLMIRTFQAGTKRSKFNKHTLLVTYYANVRSILEYGCVVWAGAAKSHTERVDRVQHKFLLWLNSHTSSPCSSLSYPSLLHHFGITSLSVRRNQHDLLFLRNILAGKIRSSNLLGRFPLHVPPRSTRSQRLFAELPWRVRTVGDGFLRRLPKAMNVFLTRSPADVFSDSSYTFRGHVLNYVKGLEAA